MSLVLARQKAAQAWCEPTTKNITMIPELAFAFADILEEAWNSPIVGNATTRELLEELESRAEINTISDCRTIDDMLAIFHDKKIDLSVSLKEVEETMREQDARRHTIEGKLSEVDSVIRYLKHGGAKEI